MEMGDDDSIFDTKDYWSLSRAWLPKERLKYLWKYGWARLSDANLDSIVSFSKNEGLVEIGAGSGYVAHLLRQKGSDVVSYDIKDDMTFQQTWKRLACENEVKKGGAKEVAIYYKRVLMVVWPHNGVCREILNILGNFKKFIFVGEMCPEDRMGLCCNKGFFSAVEKLGFNLAAEPQDIDNFAFQYGKLLFFEKDAPPLYKVPVLTWHDYFDRAKHESFGNADYYMSVRDVDWFNAALYNLRNALVNLEAENKSNKHGVVLTNELRERYEKKIAECEQVVNELTPEDEK
eukprot:Phypoly_transcript_14550.p1 GENE.Phypoly_transcript_14550~~Phypoly_transcript_14550.p1  ORF type:complete len:289 (+),score=54.08 Phypoly_transcript_14550:94-960(+)